MEDCRSEGILPLRKRLKQVDSLHESQHIEAKKSISLPPGYKGSLSTYTVLHRFSQKCSACGNGGVLLHRMPSAGSGSERYDCSHCVLSANKQMYCFVCLELVSDDPVVQSPNAAFICRKCQRLSHMSCAGNECLLAEVSGGNALCVECNESPASDSRNAKTGLKRLKKRPGYKMKNVVIDEQALVAAQIVASIAHKEACRAKERAMALAKDAAYAAGQAKLALACISDFKGEESSSVSVAANSVNKSEEESYDGCDAFKFSRSFKRKTISAIVASQKPTKELGIASSCDNVSTIVTKTGHKRKIVVDIRQDMIDSNVPGMSNEKQDSKKAKALSLGIKSSNSCKNPLRKLKDIKISSNGKLEVIISHVFETSKTLPEAIGRDKMQQSFNANGEGRLHVQVNNLTAKATDNKPDSYIYRSSKPESSVQDAGTAQYRIHLKTMENTKSSVLDNPSRATETKQSMEESSHISNRKRSYEHEKQHFGFLDRDQIC